MTFSRVCQNQLVGRVVWRGCDTVGLQRHHERDGPVPDRSDPPGREGGPLRRGGRWDWRGWQRRENGRRRWVNK